MVAHLSQPGILAASLLAGRSVSCRLLPAAEPRMALARLRDRFDPNSGIIGLSRELVERAGGAVPGLRDFPVLPAAVTVPSTQQAMWIMLRGADPSAIFDRWWTLAALLDGAFEVTDARDTFIYAGGRDLTGYEDGTENPKDEAAVEAALVPAGQPGLSGSSFVAVQRWVHDLRKFQANPPDERDRIIGRSRQTNEELADAPATAHVKMSAQESYDPPAFMLRHSMPWMTEREQGLEFVAYGRSLDAYERVLRRMAGVDGGIVDALFRFSRPVSGGYYWCPPIADGKLDLSQLKL